MRAVGGGGGGGVGSNVSDGWITGDGGATVGRRPCKDGDSHADSANTKLMGKILIHLSIFARIAGLKGESWALRNPLLSPSFPS